ncbi:MAG: hypothetical protein ACREJ3_09660 [Polyangiaceae bacterium]
MSWVQIQSVEPPLNRREVAAPLAAAIRHADAMGLLPKQISPVARLDLERLVTLLAPVSNAGIARQPIADLAREMASPRRLADLLELVDEALVESPFPPKEWTRCADVLGSPVLSRLLGISESSLRRYQASRRETPDDVANRLHFLALVVSDLAGAYNDLGVRGWFDRPRPQLDNKTPGALLRGAWNPGDPGPSRVRELAESLTASPAT